jgi:hypothetical protein
MSIAPRAAPMMAQPANSSARTPLVGVWKLLSFETEFKDGSPRRPTFGERPSGYIIFTGEGRMMAVIEAEGRKAPSTEAHRSALLQTLSAYSGTYSVDGDQWTTTVDVAWNPVWKGTQQVRTYVLAGDRLTVTSMWQPAVNLKGSPMSRGILVFERVKY